MTDTATAPKRLLDGRYELGPVIGQGTFGRVFRGYDRRLARPVAIKLIKPWWTEEPEWAERFEREAQLMARINDPGIVQIHDIGYGEDGLYYVAELVDGESLSERLRRGPLAPLAALDIAGGLCRALIPAHDQRVVHRDIKPGNVLLARDGRVKVGDFGVARLAEGTSDGYGGTVIGTPRYMAPEQARGQLPTPATDVYGVGVVLYEMLAGRPPFREGSAVELALRHMEDPPPPLPEETPRQLVDVVARALAKDPTERYPSAREMATALDAARPAVAGADAPAAPSVAAGAASASAPKAAGPNGTLLAPRRTPRRNVNPSESRRYRALLVGAALLVAALIAGALLMSRSTVRVPALSGLSQTAVRARLQHAGLQPSFNRRPDATAPVGTVIAQSPAAASDVSGGSHVSVTLSAGPPPVSLPQLQGQQTAAAEAIVSRLGLTATVNQVPAPGVTPGLVIQQIPDTTTVRPHSHITLQVAETPRWHYMDSLTGSDSGRDSGPFVIRGSRWRIVQSMSYNGTCALIFFCSGPTATVTNATTGAKVTQFDLSEGSNQATVLSTGPGTYDVQVTPGSDSAQWSIQVQDDY